MISTEDTCLPPSTQTNQQTGYLNITPVDLTFFQKKTRTHLIKMHFWGTQQPNYLPIGSTHAFPIVANITRFKLYLLDAKITQVDVIDSRNYKVIGSSFLSWSLYLRSINDQQLINPPPLKNAQSQQKKYYLPFFDAQMEELLPIYKFGANCKGKNNQRIGEICLKWQCKIFERLQQPLNTPSRMPSQVRFSPEQNDYNIRVSHLNHRSNIIKKPISICNIDMVQEESVHEPYRNEPSFNKFGTFKSSRQESQYPKYSPSVHSLERGRKQSESKGNTLKDLQHPFNNQLRQFPTETVNLDLQLMRIRMDMAEYSSAPPLSSQRHLKIFCLQLFSRQLNIKDLLYMDINCKGQEGNNKVRLFYTDVVKNKVVFNSCLGVKVGTEVGISVLFKKGKDSTIKGILNVGGQQQNFDINLLSSDGIISGTLKLSILAQRTVGEKEQNSQIPTNDKPLIPKQLPTREKQSAKIQQKDYFPLLISPVDNFIPKMNQKTVEKKEQSKQSLLYYLALFQEHPQCQFQSYGLFDKKVEGMGVQKYSIFPQKQVIGKIFEVKFFNKDQLLVHVQRNKPLSKPGKLDLQNLTCSLILQKHLNSLKVTFSLHSGSVQQIAHLMQELTQHILLGTNTLSQPKHSLVSPQRTQEYRMIQRKMKTQEGLRLQTQERRMTEQRVQGQSNTAHQLQLHHDQPEPAPEENNENLYLVDLLTRFLHQIANYSLPVEEQIQQQRFMKVIQQKNQETEMPLQVLEAISSVFQDEPNAPISLVSLKQSLKAFTTFFALYNQERTKIVRQILEQEPKAIEKIRNNAELGMINENILWSKTLSKINKTAIRQKVNKFYRISAFGPTQAFLLIQDLQSNTNKLRSMDICNLGMLIKDWVQQFLNQLNQTSLKGVKDRMIEMGEQGILLNIRTVNFVFETEMGLKLSLWQSLMLIQEIKSAYICDLEVGQGLISGEVFLAWSQNSINRQKQRIPSSLGSSKQSQHSFYFERQSRMKNTIKHKNNSGVSLRPEGLIQNKNNDSQIVDIANLLRQRQQDEEKRRTLQQIEQPKVPLGQSQVKKKRSPRMMTEDLKPSSEESQSQRQFRKKNTNICAFQLQVVELKLYQNFSNNMVKLTVSLDKDKREDNQNFFYLTQKMNFSEANGKLFNIRHNSNRHQTIFIKISSEDKNNGYAALDWQEYSQWYNTTTEHFKKTMVVYSDKGKIIGKIIISLTKNQFTTKPTEAAPTEELKLKLISTVPFTNDWFYLTIGDSLEENKAEVGKEYGLTLTKPIYSYQITIFSSTKQCRCTILLQELYLRKYTVAEYPLVNLLTGGFQANLKIEMAVQGQPLGQEPLQSSLHIQPEQDSPKKMFEERLKKNVKVQKTSRGQKNNLLLQQIDSIYQSLKRKMEVQERLR